MTEKKAKASRKTVKKRKPSFKRHEQFRCKKLKKTWRKPRGRHSKMRVRVASRGRMPSIGYRNPPEVRGL
ncbi:MAG: eL32 family ribosomal protein, partial [Candidatus Aenigmatarchaeota archaeon]